MRTVNVDLGDRSYPVHIGTGLLGRAALLEPHLAGADVLVVSNATVAPLYLAALRAALPGRRVIEHILPDGERHKTLQSFAAISDTLVAAGCHRDTTVIALGGGVVGDLAGFVAACYQRGVAFVQVPTTLLAQVDASVGGKTGVNHPDGKNLIGAFHQPRCVLADLDTLATLPERELRAGLGEVIKHALVADRAFFEWLEGRIGALVARDPETLAHAVQRCCEIKAGIVMADEREAGQRAVLNLGHTFAHALEAATDYRRWLHGEAVAIGLALAARLAAARGMLTGTEQQRIGALLEQAGLATGAPGLASERLIELMGMDKKVRAGRWRLILPNGLGRADIVADVAAGEIRAVLAEALAAADPVEAGVRR